MYNRPDVSCSRLVERLRQRCIGMRSLVLVAAVCVTACGDSTGPQGFVRFADHDINLGGGISGQFQLTNESSEPIEGITFDSDPPVNRSGVVVDGARLTVLSGPVGSLEPGRKLSFPFTIEITSLPPDEYSLELRVLVDGVESDRTRIRFVR